MHIEPGIVDGAKIVFSYATAAGAAGYAVKLIRDEIVAQSAASFAVRALIATVGVFVFFEIMPHFAVGVSEVHFILGTTLFLILGGGAASVGLAAGLFVQGALFAPADLPQYCVNVTTLLVPLFAMMALARRVIPANTAYVDLAYADVLKLSAVYQSGIIAWVAFWAIYGQGFGAENLASVGSFAAAYILVVVIEPVVDLAVLAGAKALRGINGSGIVTPRLYNAA